MRTVTTLLNLTERHKSHAFSLKEFEYLRQETLRREEENRKAERINHLIQQVPLRFRGKTFDDYEIENEFQTRVKNLAMRYVQTFSLRVEEGASIKFMGKPGTGKTLLSLIIYQELVKAGYSARYETSLEFVKNLLEIKFKSQTNFQSYTEQYKNVQLLIIDEITESINKDGAPSELEKSVLFNIIDHRYEKKLCTIIITNRDNTELVKRLGSPIVDRLTENGISLAFNWNSYRQK